MSILERTYGQPADTNINEVLISSDSHVIEPEGLWTKRLPKAFQERAPGFGGRRKGDHPGAMEGTKPSMKWPPTASARKFSTPRMA